MIDASFVERTWGQPLGDDESILDYANWLEEHGAPRAAFWLRKLTEPLDSLVSATLIWIQKNPKKLVLMAVYGDRFDCESSYSDDSESISFRLDAEDGWVFEHVNGFAANLVLDKKVFATLIEQLELFRHLRDDGVVETHREMR